MEHKLDEPCVHIYAAMGLYGESVDLALKVSTACLPACVLNFVASTSALCRLMWSWLEALLIFHSRTKTSRRVCG